MGINRNRKILCIPDIGHALAEDNWFSIWKNQIDKLLVKDGYCVNNKVGDCCSLIPFRYRDSIKNTDIDSDNYARALAELAFGLPPDVLGHLFRQNDGIHPDEEALKWRAAAIMQWAQHESLRNTLRRNLIDVILKERPDVILAFSLGSLIAYDALLEIPGNYLSAVYFISFGSQLGSPYVKNLFAGRIQNLPVKHWYNLFNPHDSVFTASLYLQEENYSQVIVSFDNPDPLDHTAVSTGESIIGYVDHYATRQLVWPVVMAKEPASRFLKSVRRSLQAGDAFNSPDHRALLIGVDQYQDTSVPDLFGCVNDTYLLSQTLQSAGFPPQNIRMLHNNRATKAAILDRISWLLDDIEPGEFRLLHFSGHGAQMESYGVGETADRLDECLCPYEFSWSVQSAIMDDMLCELYSQLHYAANLVIVLDCCHSGGMARNGQSIRGLSAPGDVAHRGLFYQQRKSINSPHEYGTWLKKAATTASKLPFPLQGYNDQHHPFMINPEFFSTPLDSDQHSLWFGKHGTIRKIGRSPSLRRLPSQQYDTNRKRFHHLGPYLPIILEACREGEPALEHTQGSVAHGAFSFALCQSLGKHFSVGKNVNFAAVMQDCKTVMQELGYTQTPMLLAPSSKLIAKLPL